MITYTTWISLFALSLEFLPSVIGTTDISVKSYWKNIDEISSSNVKGLYIEYYYPNNENALLTYILVPWSDFSKSTNFNDISAILDKPTLKCVTPFALVYEKINNENADNKSEIIDKITQKTDLLFDADFCSTLINSEDGISIDGGFQVIKESDYPYYSELSIALPGSAPIDPLILKQNIKNRMLYISLVPDMGEIKKSWLFTSCVKELEAITNIQENLTDQIQKEMLSSFESIDPELRSEKYQESIRSLREFFNNNQLDDKSIQEFYFNLLRRLMLLDSLPLKEINTHPVFGNYQEKTTPDLVTDYMPEILGDLVLIPEAKLENLANLLQLYNEYSAKAKANPGETIEGNLVLSGMPEEYHPSIEELMLGEIGERISEIRKQNSEKGIKKYLRSEGLKKTEIKYVKFSFIHYDVMGSGRVFYVETMDNIQFKLP